MAADDFDFDTYIPRVFQLESGGDPSQVTGSNRGLAQFSPDLERKYGITNWKDPTQQSDALRRESLDFMKPLTATLGRTPNQGEMYLAHQQGLAGAQAHFNNPAGVAWQNIARYYPNASVARDAIWGNIPDNPRISPNFNKTMFPGGVNSVTSGDFINGWLNKYGAPGTMIAQYAPGAGSTSPGTPGAGFSSILANPPTPGEINARFGTSIPADDMNAATGGMLAGTTALNPAGVPGGNNAFAGLANIGKAFMQPKPQIKPAQFQPIQMAVPAGIRAQLAAAALRGEDIGNFYG